MRFGGSATLVTGLLLSFLPVVAQAEPPAAPTPSTRATHRAGPDRLLPRRAHGRKALELLGSQVGEAAQRNHMSAGRLERVLSEDSTAWLDPTGRMFYVDPASASGSSAPDQTSAVAGAADPSQAFLLHSKPWSKRKVFIDLDGTTVSGTSWNVGHGLPDGFYQGLTTDGDASTFSTSERAVVQQIWSRVAEDFAPFEVDVTTEDPGDAGLRRSTPLDLTYGVRALVTSSAQAHTVLCDGGSPSCSGIAFVGTFDELNDEGNPLQHDPAWAFTTAGSVGNPNAVADTVSHEVGHSFGLHHDGLGSAPYHPGDSLWAPIMGAAGGKPVTQWSDGDYPGSTNPEDDLATIAAHGTPVVTDDHGDTRPTATRLQQVAAASTSGVISARGDVDVFGFDVSCAGTVQVDVTPGSAAPDLDLGVTLSDSVGTTLAESAPTTVGAGTYPDLSAAGLDAHVSKAVTAGTYYVTVDGLGQSEHYGDYGSLGPYSLSVSRCSTGAAVPVTPSRPADLTLDQLPAELAGVLSWRPPTSDGGSAVTEYDVLSNGAPVATVPATQRSVRIEDLHGATPYTFSVRARSAGGTSIDAQLSVTTRPFPPSAPSGLTASSTGLAFGQVRFTFTPPAFLNGQTAPLTYLLHRGGLGADEETATDILIGGSGAVVGGFLDGTTYTVDVRGLVDNPENARFFGDAVDGRRSQPVTFTYTRPKAAAPTGLTLTPAGAGVLTVSWTPPSPIGTIYEISIDRSGATDSFGLPDFFDSVEPDVRSYQLRNLVAGRTYTVTLQAQADGVGPSDPVSATITMPATAPGATRIGKAASGARGGAVTATARWAAPTSSGGAAITAYRVTAMRLSTTGTVLRRTTVTVGASVRAKTVRLAKGRYRFTVVAVNRVGAGRSSARSNLVTAR